MQLSYQELLNHDNWKNRRKEILIRDGLECLNCRNKNLLNETIIGSLSFQGLNNNGTLFSFLSDSLEFRQKVFIPKDSLLINTKVPVPLVGYISKTEVSKGSLAD